MKKFVFLSLLLHFMLCLGTLKLEKKSLVVAPPPPPVWAYLQGGSVTKREVVVGKIPPTTKTLGLFKGQKRISQRQNAIPAKPASPLTIVHRTPQPLPALIQLIYEKIAAQPLYPKGAVTRKTKAGVRFILHPDGSLSHITLSQSSGDAEIDRAALQTVAKISPISLEKTHLRKKIKMFVNIIYAP